MAMICGQKSTLPSCEARQNMAMICGQKTTLPSCVARQNVAMICGQKSTLPSCEARQNMTMICGQKTTSPSCVVRQNMAMICGQKTTLPSCAVRQNMAMICGKLSTESRTQPSCKTSINYSLDCGNTNCIVASPEHIENSDMVVKHFDKVQSAIETNQKRKRDREPSRIPVRKVLKLLKRKISRRTVQNFLRQSVPDTSCISFLCSNYKYWNLWYNNEHYFGKYVFFF